MNIYKEASADYKEIIFRAKEIGTGKWIFGCYAPFRVPFTKNEITHQMFTVGESSHTIDITTLGRYSGFKDSNGYEIFEGDIIRDNLANADKNLIIVFKEGCFCYSYEINAKNKKSLYYVPISDREFGIVTECCEIIGNIYDNQELLKGII